MKTDSKPGFTGQWVEIFSTGTHPDSAGRLHAVDTDYLVAVARNFKPELHEPPAVIGHPTENAPAYGYVAGLRVNEDKLEARFSDVDPDFERLVREGKFKKRSASFYTDSKSAPGGRAPSLRHVGFLGAQPPAVKGLKNIQFSDGESLTFEFAEADPRSHTKTHEGAEMDEKDIKSFGDRVLEYFKGLVKKDDVSASFSEADVKKVVGDAVKAATAEFTEKLDRANTALAEMQKRVDAQSSSATHDTNVAFCEKLGKAKIPPAFLEMGVVQFMDALAAVPDRKITVISFAEDKGVKKEIKTESEPLAWFRDFLEKLPTFIQFGEHFNSIKATGDAASALIDPKQLDSMRETMGVKKICLTEVLANAD